MSNADEHAAAIEGVNESEVAGRTVYVSESLPKEQVAENKKKYQANKQSEFDSTQFFRFFASSTKKCLSLNHGTLHFTLFFIGNQGTKIYVGNLNFDTTHEDLQATFEEYGEVKDCFIPTDYDGNPRGFAFIQMEEDNAVAAIEGLNGTQLDGRTLNVNKSLPKGTRQTPKREFVRVGIDLKISEYPIL